MAEPAPELRVMVVDSDAERSRQLRGALTLAGYHVVAELKESLALPDAVRGLKPHIVIVAADSPDRDTLEHISLTTRNAPRPVVMFTQDRDSESIRAAVKAGVSAYVVDGLKKERVKPILDMAISRFNAFSRLTRELEQARSELEDRKIIEQAKGILMRTRSLSEADAYALLRSTAMNQNRRMVDIAQSLVTAADLLGP